MKRTRLKKTGKRTAKHKYYCRKYRKKFLEEHGYIFCESVNCENPNQAFPPHSTHHIMSAGRYPSHPELHNDLNLILLCHKCHEEFEQFKREKEHDLLVEQRGLKELFGIN
jgi:hypothetical protein